MSDFTFELNLEGDGYILISYNNKEDFDVVIPKEYEGLPIKVIGEDAFNAGYTETPLNSVAIPNSVILIGVNSFAQNQLMAVIIPDSVTSVDYGAFAQNQLASVTMGGSVKTIESDAFYEN